MTIGELLRELRVFSSEAEVLMWPGYYVGAKGIHGVEVMYRTGDGLRALADLPEGAGATAVPVVVIVGEAV